MLENKKLVNILIIALCVICVGLLCVDLFHHKHGHFTFESWFGFYAFYGFIAYMVIVNCAKLLLKLVRRDENYYD